MPASWRCSEKSVWVVWKKSQVPGTNRRKSDNVVI